MKLLRHLLILAAVLGLAAYLLHRSPPPAPSPPVLVLDRVRHVLQLAVVCQPVHTIQATELAGYTGGLRCLLIVHGEITVGIDAEQVRVIRHDVQDRVLVLGLPPPQLMSARIDHGRSRVFTVDRTGLWCLYPGEAGESRVIAKAWACAERGLMDLGNQGDLGDQGDLAEQARQRVKQLVASLGQQLQYRIEIQWLPSG